MRKQLDQYVIQVLRKSGKRFMPSEATLSTLAGAGATSFMVSKKGIGKIMMRSRLNALKRARDQKYEAILHQPNSKKTFALADGIVFEVDERSLSAQITRAKFLPIANYQFVEIPFPAVETPTVVENASNDDIAAFRASAKKGMRGTDIRSNGEKLTLEQVAAVGWKSSFTK